jgi:dimethylargininase
MIRALVRDVPSSFSQALSAAPPDPPIDPALAREQHAAYVAALRACGAEVSVLAADESCPDCCFIEDTAVVFEKTALITRPGAPSRRAETPAVEAALARDHRLVRMTGEATLEGGDCLRLGSRLYVGLSSRTNAEGCAQLAAAFPRLLVVPVELPPGVLHLKCVCSPLGEDRVALAEDSLPAQTFGGAAVVWIPAAETYASNLVAIGSHAVVAEGYPRAHQALEKAGFTLHPVPASEVRKADGSLTCQSILIVQ